MKFSFSPRVIFFSFSFLLVVFYAVGVFWSIEPDGFDIKQQVENDALVNNEQVVVGYATTTALIRVSETLLNKSGGYLSNDVTPPSVFLDNIPSWEFGVLEMVRDMSLVMRREFSRSQSQSVENEYLKKAQPLLNFDNKSWVIPSSESEYGKAIALFYQFRSSLTDPNQQNAQFYARADNLRDWLNEVEKRLGSYSQRLSTSVGRDQLNTNLAGDSAAQQSTATPSSARLKTNWWQIDDTFYEARGACWALLHFLKAIEIDFADVLAKKNAKVSVRQIIRELEASQEMVWSPMVLNGSGFGLLANHSLVMANYISRANAAIIDLSELLSQG